MKWEHEVRTCLERIAHWDDEMRRCGPQSAGAIPEQVQNLVRLIEALIAADEKEGQS